MKLFTAVLLIGIAPAMASAQRGSVSQSSVQPMPSQQSFSEQRSISFSPQTSPFQSEQPVTYSAPATLYTPQQSSYQSDQYQPSFNTAPSMQYTPQQSDIPQEQPQRAASSVSSSTSAPNVSSNPRNDYPTEASRWLPENDFAQPHAKNESSIPQSSPNVLADQTILAQPEVLLQNVQNDLADANLNAIPGKTPSTADVLTYYAKRNWLKDKPWLRKNYLDRQTNFFSLYGNVTSGPYAYLSGFCSHQNHLYCCDTCDTTCLTHYLKFRE